MKGLSRGAERVLLGGVVVILLSGGIATYAKANQEPDLQNESCAEITDLPEGAIWRRIDATYGYWEHPVNLGTLGYSVTPTSIVYRHETCLPGV